MLNMTLMRENIEELSAFIDLAHELGVNAVQFWPLHDYDPARTAHWQVERGGWLFNYRQQMLGHNAADAEHANAIIDRALERAQELAVPVIWPVGGRTRIVAPSMVDSHHTGIGKTAASHVSTTTHSLRECVAPWEWLLVDERGDVRPCCYVEQSFGNLRHISPEAIWNGPDYREMRRDLARDVLPPQCRNAACKFARGRWIYT